MSDLATPRKLTPADIAARYGIAVDKVLVWIHSGDLRAINVATTTGGRPRWFIDPADLLVFENRRSPKPIRPTKRRQRMPAEITPYF